MNDVASALGNKQDCVALFSVRLLKLMIEKRLNSIEFDGKLFVWLTNLLSDRTQVVGFQSGFLSVNQGVPQGTIL